MQSLLGTPHGPLPARSLLYSSLALGAIGATFGALVAAVSVPNRIPQDVISVCILLNPLVVMLGLLVTLRAATTALPSTFRHTIVVQGAILLVFLQAAAFIAEVFISTIEYDFVVSSLMLVLSFGVLESMLHHYHARVPQAAREQMESERFDRWESPEEDSNSSLRGRLLVDGKPVEGAIGLLLHYREFPEFPTLRTRLHPDGSFVLAYNTSHVRLAALIRGKHQFTAVHVPGNLTLDGAPRDLGDIELHEK